MNPPTGRGGGHSTGSAARELFMTFGVNMYTVLHKSFFVHVGSPVVSIDLSYRS